jgi:hypothetical protein
MSVSYSPCYYDNLQQKPLASVFRFAGKRQNLYECCPLLRQRNAACFMGLNTSEHSTLHALANSVALSPRANYTD